MKTTMIEPTKRNLPVSLPKEVERMGCQILAALDRLGFVNQNQDGGVFGVQFSDAVLIGDEYALYAVDCERLWHFSVGDLSKQRVVSHLEAVVRKPIRVNTADGLVYVVRLKNGAARPQLPARARLDLERRPAGEMLVPVGLGRDGDVWAPLDKLGHCLIVGATGAGKSTFVHAALAALLTKCGPEALQVALVDPKRSELTPWAGAPHLVGEIAHTPEETATLLGRMVGEIDRRGEMFASARVRDLAGYNRRADSPLPYIVVVIDETLDAVLMAGEKGAATQCLKVIATRGRSAGVALWCATQHASAVSGLPRVVNVNLGTRLVFRVNDRDAARTAGCPGAERIDRRKPGRMLANLGGKAQELQGYWVSEAEVEAIAEQIGGVRSAAASVGLSSGEAALVGWAVEQNGGYLGLAEIQQVGEMGQREARRLAERWERRGWLEKDRSAGNRRRVTEALWTLCAECRG